VKLRAVLGRIVLVGGVASVVELGSRTAPQDQSIAVRLNGREVTRVEGVITKTGESEGTLGFSQSFPDGSPSTVRHSFSAPSGDYAVAITLHERSPGSGGVAKSPTDFQSGDAGPIRQETSFERRVTLDGGEVVLSPD
jgi:hypothetical protein